MASKIRISSGILFQTEGPCRSCPYSRRGKKELRWSFTSSRVSSYEVPVSSRYFRVSSDEFIHEVLKFQWRASSYDRRNNSVCSAFLSWSNDVIDGGSRLYQTFAAATRKARSPIVSWFNRGRSAVDAERSRLYELMSATRCRLTPQRDAAALALVYENEN